MYVNKVYSSSEEYILSHPSPNRTFDIELQHPQPRRRQAIEHYHQTTDGINPFTPRAYAVPAAKQNQNYALQFDQRSLDNNLMNIPSNPLFTPDPTAISVSPTSEVIEER